jgi:hypothetical protein
VPRLLVLVLALGWGFGQAPFDLPFTVEYREEDTGLGLLIPGLPLQEGVSLQAGVVGLDRPEHFSGIFLVRGGLPGLSFAVGRAREGVQADVVREETLAPGLRALFGVHNRHWPEQDFLHEGFFRLDVSPSLPAEMDLTVTNLLAVSHQILPEGPITSPRLGLSYSFSYRFPETAWGTLSLVQTASAIFYPRVGRTQLGARVSPSWRGNLGPLATSLDYTLQLSNGASPFSLRLDRLAPISAVAWVARLETEPGALALRGHYDFFADPARRSRWRELHVAAEGGLGLWGWEVSASASLEAAGLLAEVRDPHVKAYVGAAFDANRDDWEVGVRGRYDFLVEALEVLEASLGLPLTAPATAVKPFFALDVADMVSGRGGLRLSGHGLVITLYRDYGILTVGYRLHEDRFTTTFELRVAD